MKATARFVCPSREVHELELHGRDSAVCPRCGRLAWVVLKTLREISALPDAMGTHACECGHPEMRRLPDGVYRCPACGLEVLPISPPRSGRTHQTQHLLDARPREAAPRKATPGQGAEGSTFRTPLLWPCGLLATWAGGHG